MIDAPSKDRLQPSLLDRLTDHKPEERRETDESRVLSKQQLRAAVLRDLGWLFNATRPEPEAASTRKDEIELWRANPHARNSVLNFGMPAFAGVTKSTLNRKIMEGAVRQAILAFEPRINAASLEVEIHVGSKAHYNALQLTIRGALWAQPTPMQMLVTSEMDLESGHTQMQDLRK